ncbi:MAG: DUF1289 domain-containing protein [Pseudomonadota bacterium]
MTNEVWKRAEIESPCVKQCVVHPEARVCTGCLRTLDEIGAWGSFTPERRRAIIDELPNRKPLLAQRRGGRQGRLRGRQPDGISGNLLFNGLSRD